LRLFVAIFWESSLDGPKRRSFQPAERATEQNDGRASLTTRRQGKTTVVSGERRGGGAKRASFQAGERAAVPNDGRAGLTSARQSKMTVVLVQRARGRVKRRSFRTGIWCFQLERRFAIGFSSVAPVKQAGYKPALLKK